MSSRRLSTRGWVGLMCGIGISGMVALRSIGWLSSLGGGSEVGVGDWGEVLAAGCAGGVWVATAGGGGGEAGAARGAGGDTAMAAGGEFTIMEG